MKISGICAQFFECSDRGQAGFILHIHHRDVVLLFGGSHGDGLPQATGRTSDYHDFFVHARIIAKKANICSIFVIIMADVRNNLPINFVRWLVVTPFHAICV